MTYEFDQKDYEDAIEHLLDQNDGWIDFGGDDNCLTTCDGWDGKSRRCGCGNRRVYWDWDHGSDGTLYVFPMVD